jgi:putative polyketide hydroxylase
MMEEHPMLAEQSRQARLTEANSSMPSEVPVLIVGGGPVGLSMSMLLARHGIRSLLVEQHPGTSIYPKARLVNARTMEIFRLCGLEQAVRASALPLEQGRNVVWAKTLAGAELARRTIETNTPEPVRAWSPTFGVTSSQEVLEPILLAHARLLEPAQIRFDTQLATFQQVDEFVTATLVHRPSGRTRQVRARYLVGADGAHSQARATLGIAMKGLAAPTYSINILFRADLERWVGDRSINICMIRQPEAPGVLLALDGKESWYYQAFYYPDSGQRAEDYTSDRCVQVLRTAIGVPDLDVDIIRAASWSDEPRVADHFSDRRAFLSGDAAHVVSPAGGFGMNVGIQDAHNLAWKLAAVLSGRADPALLQSYHEERAPVARWITDQTLRNLASLRRVNSGNGQSPASHETLSATLGRLELFREHGMVFGASYESQAIVPDGTPPVAVANPVTDYLPNARPGNRAPHVWLERSGERISTIDLFDREFVLLAGDRGESWCEAAREVAGSLRIPIQTYLVGPRGDLVDGKSMWAALYGVGPDGAVLVRPDGYVAWRRAALGFEPAAELGLALRSGLGYQSMPEGPAA